MTVSNAGFQNFEKQDVDAQQFIEANREFLHRAGTFPGVEHFVLDFGIEFSEQAPQTSLFRSEFVSTAASVGLAIQISSYPQ